MREIKFRAWDDTEKRWRYETVESIYNSISLGDTSACEVGEHCSDIFCQFTGLKDKNGNEIYEGDVVKHTKLGINERHQWIDKVPDMTDWGWLLFSDSSKLNKEQQLEVIGNIYENPELLK